MNRALSFPLVRERIAEEGHDPIAVPLIDVTLVAGDAHSTLILIAPNDPLQDFRIDSIGQLGKADHIAEQHGELAALPFECVLGRGDLLSKMLWGVRLRRTWRRDHVTGPQSLDRFENRLARS